MELFSWKMRGWRYTGQDSRGVTYSNVLSQIIEIYGKCIRIVIPVVVGSSPISHPNKFKHLQQNQADVLQVLED